MFPLFPSVKNPFPEEYRLDIKPYLNRPFFCGTSTWTATNTRFQALTIPITQLPRTVLTSNMQLGVMARMAALMRCKLCINISLTGTISHSGLLLASVTPPRYNTTIINTDNGRAINTMLSGPHAFLAANEASSVCLEVPFYCNADYEALDVNPVTVEPTMSIIPPNMNLALLSVMVLNPLMVSTGASTSLTLVFEAFFKSCDAYVPTTRLPTMTNAAPTLAIAEGQSFLAKAGTKLLDSSFQLLRTVTADGIDAVRSTIRAYTGLHNPNNPTLDTKSIMSLRNYQNTVDSGVCYERLDPYTTSDRIVQDPIFQTSVDEMSISNITSKPQYIGTFTAKTTDNVGALLFARPISPYQGGSAGGALIANNIELLYHMTRAWRGGLKLHIQSSMNNKQNVKLQVSKYYTPSSNIQSQYPSMASLASVPSDLIEFSQGNQVHTIKLPFLSRNALLYNSRIFASLGSILGMYYVYVAQPLVIGDASPTSVEFNVYMSCDNDFQYYGYSTEVAALSYVTPPAAELDNQTPALNDPSILDPPPQLIKEGQSLEVMNKPSLPNELLKHTQVQKDIDDTRLVPLVDIRPLIRRNQFALSRTITIDPVTGFFNTALPLATLIGEAVDQQPRGSVGVVPGMFYGKQCGLKFKLVCTTTSLANIAFIPPNCSAFRNGVLSRIVASQPSPTTVGHWYNLPPGNVKPGLYPVPQIEFPQFWATNSDGPMAEFEFSIPNTSIYNFIGGPEKMTGGTQALLSIADLGTLLFTFSGKPGAIVEYCLYYSYTDETRLGFQVIAPVIALSTSSTTQYCSPYSDTTGSNPLFVPSPHFYFTNTPTTFN